MLAPYYTQANAHMCPPLAYAAYAQGRSSNNSLKGRRCAASDALTCQRQGFSAEPFSSPSSARTAASST